MKNRRLDNRASSALNEDPLLAPKEKGAALPLTGGEVPAWRGIRSGTLTPNPAYALGGCLSFLFSDEGKPSRGYSGWKGNRFSARNAALRAVRRILDFVPGAAQRCIKSSRFSRQPVINKPAALNNAFHRAALPGSQSSGAWARTSDGFAPPGPVFGSSA